MTPLEQFHRDNFTRLCHRIRPKVGGHQDIAEDVVQTAFCNAIKYQHHYDPDRGKLSTWFNTIMYNTLRDVQRANANEPLEELTDYTAPEVLQELSLRPSVDTSLIIQEALSMVANKKHKRVLELFFILGFSAREIAFCEDDMTVTNVTTIINRYKEGL